ncbi:MAG: hypothetical protein HY785_00730 [Oscillatoriophycideae cyanobacterium NC_groundwater_1537_Pr4_S-0.65um_50_18]|nr:hypothetical protein [Oscillatoriophycideae cyanobacterium NC_groundwater_1537_Pr4_S-0.65um_50_18]
MIGYSRATGNLFYNPNGAAPGWGGGGQVATLNGKPSLSGVSFVADYMASATT